MTFTDCYVSNANFLTFTAFLAQHLCIYSLQRYIYIYICTAVDYFFNRRDAGFLYPGIISPNLNESVEKSIRAANVQQPESAGKTFNCNSYGTKLSPIAEGSL